MALSDFFWVMEKLIYVPPSATECSLVIYRSDLWT